MVIKKNILMKKLLIQIGLFALVLFVAVACDKDDNDSIPPEMVENITVTPDYGALLFKWNNPADEDLYYVDIAFSDSKGNARSVKTSLYADSVLVDGFSDTQEYLFEVTAYDRNGNASSSQMVKGTPLEPAFLSVMSTVQVVPDFGGAKISWNNITGKKVVVRVNYQDNDGAKQSVAFDSESGAGEGFISGLNAEEKDFVVVVADVKDNSSDPKTFTMTPLFEEKLDKSNWTVIDLSTEEPGEGAPNGLASAALDDNLGTFWHTSWATYGQPGYPHYFTVDMGSVVTISRFECFRRQGDNRGQTKIQFLVSEDGENWSDMGEYDFDSESDEGQGYRMSTNPKARYFKYVAVEGPNFFAFLAELNVYGDASGE